MEAFNEMKRKGLSPQFDTVSQIEVEDEEGHYIPWTAPCGPVIWMQEGRTLTLVGCKSLVAGATSL